MVFTGMWWFERSASGWVRQLDDTSHVFSSTSRPDPVSQPEGILAPSPPNTADPEYPRLHVPSRQPPGRQPAHTRTQESHPLQEFVRRLDRSRNHPHPEAGESSLGPFFVRMPMPCFRIHDPVTQHETVPSYQRHNTNPRPRRVRPPRNNCPTESMARCNMPEAENRRASDRMRAGPGSACVACGVCRLY